MKVKISKLTYHNVEALLDIEETLLALPGVESVATTHTTATFVTDEWWRASWAVKQAMRDLPSVGHPRASLHAVVRKLDQASPMPEVVNGQGEPVQVAHLPFLDKLLGF